MPWLRLFLLATLVLNARADLICEETESTGEKLLELLKDYEDAPRSRRSKRSSLVGMDAFLFTYQDENNQEKNIYLIKHDFAVEGVKAHFDWKKEFFSTLKDNKDFAYSFKCFRDKQLGYFFFEVHAPFQRIISNLEKMNPLQFHSVLLRFLGLFRKYAVQGMVFSDTTLFTIGVDETDLSQPILLNFHELHQQGETTYIKKVVQEGIAERVEKLGKEALNGLYMDYVEVRADEGLHLQTLKRLLNYLIGKYFEMYVSKHPEAMEWISRLSSELSRLGQQIDSADKKLPTFDEIEEIIVKHTPSEQKFTQQAQAHDLDPKIISFKKFHLKLPKSYFQRYGSRPSSPHSRSSSVERRSRSPSLPLLRRRNRSSSVNSSNRYRKPRSRSLQPPNLLKLPFEVLKSRLPSAENRLNASKDSNE